MMIWQGMKPFEVEAALRNLLHKPLRSTLTTFLTVLTILLFVYLITTELRRFRRRLPNIDGPRGLPIVGNLHQLSPDPSESMRKWAKEYGGVYQIMMGNRPVVVVSSMQAAKELFIGKGGSLVDRPKYYTFHGVLSSVASTIGTTSWSESTKIRRKAAAKAMNRTATATYIPLIDELSRDLMSDLLQHGHSGEVGFDPQPSIQQSILDLTMTVNYGARLPRDAKLFDELTFIEHKVSLFRSAIGSLQDYVPILRWNPVNFTSAHAREYNQRRLVYLNRFNNELDERITTGRDKPCIQGSVLKDDEAKLNHVDLLSISMSMVSGGLDTMAHSISWTVGALARRPDIQDTAYHAICSVYGSESWGDAGEENGVPYITALVKESLRYFSVLRLSLPRAAWHDIEYKGLFIPKGTTVFLNVWGCNRDEMAFGKDADDFRPERFLNMEGSSGLEHAAYGYGTRMCAGSHLANRQLYIMLLRIIWAFKIELSADSADNDWSVRPLQDSTEPYHLAAIPPRFKIRFVPRNERALCNLVKGE